MSLLHVRGPLCQTAVTTIPALVTSWLTGEISISYSTVEKLLEDSGLSERMDLGPANNRGRVRGRQI
jgi:hypothetical protein